MTIREAKQTDVIRLVEIVRSSPEAGNWSAGEIESSLAEPPRRCLVAVAEEEERVLGFVLVQCAVSGEAEILTVAVDPVARRRGVARRLLWGVLEAMPGRVWLEVRRSNTAAQRLYQQLGFVDVGLRRNYYSSPSEDAVVMQFTDSK